MLRRCLIAGPGRLASAGRTHRVTVRHHSTAPPETIEQRDVDDLRYPGAATADYTSSLTLWRAADRAPQPVYQSVSDAGDPIGASDVDVASWRSMLGDMLKVRTLDETFLAAQRQGRLSFYLACRGEEAAIVGATSGLTDNDVVFTQYREGAAVLLVRGASYAFFADQCVGNAAGHGRGRQMPIHYGDVGRHVQTVSSPLATQIPHAVGAARALRGSGRTAAVFFGDGAASEGDAAGAFLFAATLKVPALFLCRNNGYAISTPVAEQYAGDGIAARAVAAGVAAIRVDGGDASAVRQAVVFGREYAMKESAPVLVEIMTYRAADHSTSDDSSRYRSRDEMDLFAERLCPIERGRKVLMRMGAWSKEEEEAFVGREKEMVLEALDRAEGKPRVEAADMLEDVYGGEVKHIERQRGELETYLQNREQEKGEKSER